jgi:hypothetical protein
MAMRIDSNGEWYDDGQDPSEDASQYDPNRNRGGQGVGLLANPAGPFPPQATTDPNAGRYPLINTTQPNINSAAILDVYQKELGRAPTQAEYLSDMENAYKYGIQGSLLKDIAARAHNIPGVGDRQAKPGSTLAGTGGIPGAYGQAGAGGTSGYPTPERMTFPTPTAPTPYASQYQQNLFQAQVPEGYDARNRILNAVLASPETMGQTQQDQLFEQQKELLNAQRAQQEAQLGQNLAARGLSGIGGTALAGQLMAGQDFSTQLLGAQRDIAVRAAQQNRQDQLAALQMQEALAQGDYSRMMDVYKSNQQERMNTENFLRQAADLTQGNQLTYNTQLLQAAQAQQREMMDYYTFLENQRNARNMLNYQYTALGLGEL